MMRIEKWLPSVLTYMNLSLGFAALTVLYTGHERLALSLIIVALFFDGVDGRLARKLNVSSIFGKELDSLSDTFTFGLVPAYFYIVIQSDITVFHFILGLIFLMCGTYQVAKYNTDFLYGSAENVLLGLPVNAAGIVVAIMGYLGLFPFVLDILIILVLSYLMVTEIPYPSFKGHHPTKKIHLLIPISIMVVFIALPIVAFTLLSIYVVFGVVNIYFDFDKPKRLKAD